MLVLRQKIGRSVFINDNVEVHVLGIEGNQVKLGFNAPKDIAIWRSEIKDKYARKKK